MPVITLSRQMGSGGDDIAAAVADRLGLRLVGREVINQAACQAGVPEVALAEIDELGLLGIKPRPVALRHYQETVSDLIQKLAHNGDVLIVGRGGQVVLAGVPGVLHVQILAPRSQRVERAQTRSQISAQVAEALIDASDRARTEYLRRHYQARWDDPGLYDIVLNMAHFSLAAAADLICLAATRVSPPAEGNA